jgi:hypothetical protein
MSVSPPLRDLTHASGGRSIRSKEEEFSARALVRTFDVVGTTDRYEEFLLMLSDVVGLRHPQYTVSLYSQPAVSVTFGRP